jgi:hypothetical protein
MSINISLQCEKHPKYKAIRAPTCACPDCELLWDVRDQLNEHINALKDDMVLISMEIDPRLIALIDGVKI